MNRNIDHREYRHPLVLTISMSLEWSRTVTSRNVLHFIGPEDVLRRRILRIAWDGSTTTSTGTPSCYVPRPWREHTGTLTTCSALAWEKPQAAPDRWGRARRTAGVRRRGRGHMLRPGCAGWHRSRRRNEYKTQKVQKSTRTHTHLQKTVYIYICIYQNKTLQRTIYSSHINAVAAPPLAADRSVCSAERPIEKPLSLERRRGPQTHRTNTTGVQRRGGGGRGAPAGWGGAYRDQSVGVEGDRGKNWKLNSSPVVNLVVNLRTFVVARAWVETGVGTTLLRCWSTLWDTQRGRTQETEGRQRKQWCQKISGSTLSRLQ